MPLRSPSPKHFKWLSRTSFVEAISQSSFIGSDCSLQKSAFAESYPSCLAAEPAKADYPGMDCTTPQPSLAELSRRRNQFNPRVAACFFSSLDHLIRPRKELR